MRTLKLPILSALLIIALTTGAHAATTASVNAASGLRLRAAASSSAQTLLVVQNGAEVHVLETSGGWSAVYYPEKMTFGFMSDAYLTHHENSDFEPEISAVVSGSVVNLRESPSLSSAILGRLTRGSPLIITGISGDFYAVLYGETSGFMAREYVQISASAPKSSGASADNTAIPDTPTSITDERAQLIEFAKQYLGTPYKVGGRTPSGFDCSGFVYYCLKNFGYTLNPGASNQMDAVKLIKKAELVPGDLVFFNNGSGRRASHVGIYIGDGSFIHATTPGNPVSIDSMSDNYYSKYYVGSGRVMPTE